MGKHTEAIQIDFDPSVITYRRLLDYFWRWHRPVAAPWSQQYKSAIWVHDAAQKRDVDAELEKATARVGSKIYTEIHDLAVFYRAEDYHQKYKLRMSRPWVDALKSIYPDEKEFVDSTAAMLANALLDGSLRPDAFRERVKALELPEADETKLLSLLSS